MIDENIVTLIQDYRDGKWWKFVDSALCEPKK